MKNFYLLSLLILVQLIVNAQTTDWLFHTYHHDFTNEDKAYAITTTKDGGYVFAGKYGINGTGNGDVGIVKLNSAGTILWTKVYRDSLGDEARAIRELPDGSFIISGFTYRLGGWSGDNSYKNLLMKLDANGDTVWTRHFGSSGIAVPDGLGNGVEVADDGGFVMVGKYANGGNGNDFYIVKTDANGNTLWTKLYGGSGSDIPRSIIRTADNGFIVSGTTKSYGPNAARGNMWLLKLNASGDTSWTKVIGSADDEECYMARPTAEGGYILAGRTGNMSDMASQLYALKTDANGDSLWSKSFGNSNDNDYGRDIVQTPDKGYAIIGSRIATHGYYLLYPPLMYVVKMDSTGAKQWDKELGFDNTPNGANGLCIANTPDSGFIAAGFDQPDTASGGSEDIRAFIVKFAPLAIAVIPITAASNEQLVYPNPFNETAKVQIPETLKGSAVLDVYTMTGQVIRSLHVAEGAKTFTVNKNGMACGLYIYDLHSQKSDVHFRGRLIAE